MTAQFLAVAIFIFMFIMIVLDKIERHYVTLGCGLGMLVIVFGFCMKSIDAITRVLNVKQIVTLQFWLARGNEVEEASGINWATILFILGMMIMVEGMGESGFFRWLCLTIAKLVQYRVIPIFIAFMLMASVLSMFIDSITVILFLSVVTVEISKLLKVNPVPMILTEIFCANLGGSATMCGDPPNIIIGTSLGYSFFDFIQNTGLISGISILVIILYFYLVFRKELKEAEKNNQIDASKQPAPKTAIRNKKDFICSCFVFAIAVVLLITHSMTGLTVATIGVFIAVISLICAGEKARLLLHKVDYKTLLFFIGLFVVVGGLEETGILAVIAGLISNLSGGNSYIMVAIILWLSAISSAFVDNIPFAATMVPVIKSLAATSNLSLPILAWTLSMGTDIGGCATPIGASANVVGIAVASREGHPIGWKRYCKAAAPATIIVLIISMITIYLRYL